MRKLAIACCVVLLGVYLAAQAGRTNNPNTLDGSQLTLHLANPPQQVNSASVQAIGSSGPRKAYYWVVSTSLAGNSAPAGPFVLRERA